MLTTDWWTKNPAVRRTAARILSAVPFSLRLGRPFWIWYAFFRESENWSADELHAFQFERLRKLLRELSQTSAYYRNRLNDVDIDSIREIKDLQNRVPSLTRDEFVQNYDSIHSADARRVKLSRAQSSGTTGKALQFFHTSDDDMREWAAICYQWSRVGYDPVRSRRAEFRGLTGSRPLIDLRPDKHMLRCSVTHLKPEHVRCYAKAIRDFGADFLHGYPSAIHLLATTICADNIDFPQPRAVLLASEEVHGYQLQAIEAAFPDARIFAHYGCAERTVLAGWCEHRREYHVLPQYALVEVHPETHEIIGTNLFNTVNGFVRIRMTDTVLDWDDHACPDCGRPCVPRLVNLGGRSEDYLYSAQNGWIPPAILTYPLKQLHVVQEIQLRQFDPESIIVRYSTARLHDERLNSELNQIDTGMRRLFGAGTEIRFEHVESFPRTPSGKFKWIINEMNESPGVGFATGKIDSHASRSCHE